MSGFSLKGGWHPGGKDGKKESWRGDFKGINQIAGKFGKGKEGGAQEEREQHVSRPLSSLKDPSQFAPPPKHIAYHGAAAVPNATTPDTRGWGAPLPEEVVQQQRQGPISMHDAEEEEEKPPPGPYRVDTTGLSTTNLPKPPVRRLDGASPAPRPPPTAFASGAPKPAPRLPPRLPPRQNSRPDLNTPEPPPSYNEAAHYQAPDPGALNRLGQSGISVPGFDIGRTASPPKPPPRSPSATPPGAPQAAQVNELQARFARITASNSASSLPSFPGSSSSSKTQPAPSQGTTWEQKQASMNTARNFHKDPSSVSFSDARGAASTANNFRERHGEQVSSGVKTAKDMSSKYSQQAKDMNTKYGITGKLSGYASSAANYNRAAPASSYAGAPGRAAVAAPAHESQVQEPHFEASSSSAWAAETPVQTPQLAAAAGAKKAPPPPPKKRELVAPPPPVPLSSKPR